MVAVGAGFEGASTSALGADIVAFANSNGLFAGASLEGSYIDADNDWNALYYGQGATAQGDRRRPPLHQSRRRADPPVHGAVVGLPLGARHWSAVAHRR